MELAGLSPLRGLIPTFRFRRLEFWLSLASPACFWVLVFSDFRPAPRLELSGVLEWFLR